MHEILNSIKQNPSQNFNNNSSILKTLKNFQKPQNLGLNAWKKKKKPHTKWFEERKGQKSRVQKV